MKITFIQTGGTIDKDYPKPTMGYAFEITEPAIKSILKKVNPSFEYEIIPLLKKDSTDLTQSDRELIFDYCKKNRNDKIIITHGTDTMIETAQYLSKIKGKTIILTGAMRPQKFIDTDADFNIGAAIGSIQFLKKNIYIAMHGLIIIWNQASRNLQSGQFIKISSD